MSNKLKTKTIKADVDLLERARKAFLESSIGNVRLGDYALTTAALIVFTTQCEKKTKQEKEEL